MLGGLFSLFNLGLLFYYDWFLALVGLGLVLSSSLVIAAVGFYEVALQRRLLDLQGKIAGQVFDLLTGIAKLRVAGAEARAFARWVSSFADQRRVAWTDGMVHAALASFNAFFAPATTLVIFGVVAWRGFTTPWTWGSSFSFFTAFGQLLGGLSARQVRHPGRPDADRAHPGPGPADPGGAGGSG